MGFLESDTFRGTDEDEGSLGHVLKEVSDRTDLGEYDSSGFWGF